MTVSLSRADDADTIEVRDTGAGIEPQFIPFMFEPFRQADAASTRAHGGLGIGLTIVRRLTEMHGGTRSRWRARRRQRRDADRDTAGAPACDAAAHVPMLQRQRVASLSEATVLVVDDDPDTLELLTSTLRTGRRTTDSPQRRSRKRCSESTASPLDALVSDIAMPGQDGYTLIDAAEGSIGPGDARRHRRADRLCGPRRSRARVGRRIPRTSRQAASTRTSCCKRSKTCSPRTPAARTDCGCSFQGWPLSWRLMKTLRPSLVAMAVVMAALFLPNTSAAQSTIAVADAAAFMGAWELGLDTPQGPMSMNLVLKDADGKVAASISAPPMLPDEQKIPDISRKVPGCC